MRLRDGADREAGLAQQVNEATGGALTRAFEAAGFTGGAGKTCVVLAPGAGLTRVVVVGIGKRAGLSRKTLEEAGGHAMGSLSRDTAASTRSALVGQRRYTVARAIPASAATRSIVIPS